jgi:hypothetical protein
MNRVDCKLCENRKTIIDLVGQFPNMLEGIGEKC